MTSAGFSFAARLRRLAVGDSLLYRHLVGAAAGSFLLSLSAKALTLISSVLLARWLGSAGYGVYSSALAVLLMLGVPTTLGLPILVVRLLASYRVNEEWGLMRGLLQRVNLLVLLLSVILAGLGSAVVWALGDRLSSGHALLWAMGLLPLTALGALRSAALRGLHHIVLGQLPENVVMPGLFLGLLASWNFAGLALTPESVLALRFAAVAAAFVVGAWLLIRRLPSAMLRAEPCYDTATWARAAIPLLFLGGMSIINTQTDVLMLAGIHGAASAGVYRAASRGAELVAFSLVVINMAIQPTISHLYTAGETQRLQRVLTAAARGALAMALPLALVLALFGKTILRLVFGDEFESGALCLAILCGAQVINAGAGPVALILNMTGHERDSVVGMTIGAVVNVVLNAIFIPLWDVDGAALATGLSLVSWNFALVALVRRRTGLSSTVLNSVLAR
ncbi:polysaccharide biosynthesis C-terminal domain-containing protein [Salinisphaera sp. LB1]|uniref:oligosaccharide flippase family protein n=1 Tax=Salinisphaera sp. LB1 TaxID=2183911 RepID=UPI001313EAE2|nr:polysaccharide biosynthesis C-terminal domain-containing protein [Salinisphaera sp. LB1]